MPGVPRVGAPRMPPIARRDSCWGCAERQVGHILPVSCRQTVYGWLRAYTGPTARGTQHLGCGGSERSGGGGAGIRGSCCGGSNGTCHVGSSDPGCGAGAHTDVHTNVHSCVSNRNGHGGVRVGGVVSGCVQCAVEGCPDWRHHRQAAATHQHMMRYISDLVYAGFHVCTRRRQVQTIRRAMAT